MRTVCALTIMAFVAVLRPSPCAAQDTGAWQNPGTVRTQGRIVDSPVDYPQPLARARVRDYREEMRSFVQSIKAFARSHRKDFAVVPMNGLELLSKADPADETMKAPARTYTRSIDGVLQEAVFFGGESGKATDEARRKSILDLIDVAKANRLKVLVMDYAADARSASEAIRLNTARGHIPFVTRAKGSRPASLPPYGSRPVNENPNSILSLAAVDNFVHVRDSSRFGRQDEFALKLHGTNYDLVITDVFHGLADPLSRQAVETLKYKKLGAKRLVFAYVNVGMAATDRHYWKPEWREGDPGWIGMSVPNDPDSYFVQYWRPEWQKIIAGGPDSYIYGCIAQGFDGVVLDGVEVYRFFEGGLEAWLGLP